MVDEDLYNKATTTQELEVVKLEQAGRSKHRHINCLWVHDSRLLCLTIFNVPLLWGPDLRQYKEPNEAEGAN